MIWFRYINIIEIWRKRFIINTKTLLVYVSDCVDETRWCWKGNLHLINFDWIKLFDFFTLTQRTNQKFLNLRNEIIQKM